MKARAGIALILGAALLAPADALAAWTADPVTVHATTDACPLVAAASDAQDGAIVVWQQDDAANPGVCPLLAKRVLANGDVDASWPAAGAPVSDATVARSALGALGDGSGGAYVWWMEGASLYLTRLLTDGTIAPGWAARGKALGTLFSPAFRPLVFADGQGGIWLGWLAGQPLSASGRVMHLGPDGLGAGGWPGNGRTFAASDPAEGGLRTLAFTYAPIATGGAWVAWGDAPYDGTAYQAGSWRLKRVTAAGSTASGWASGGQPVRGFHGELLVDTEALYSPYFPPYLAAAPVAVASDGADGAYLFLSDVVVDGSLYSTPVLFHYDSTGSPDPSWPPGGVMPHGLEPLWAVDYGPEWSLRLFPGAAGGVFALWPDYYSGWLSEVTLTRISPTGTKTTWNRLDQPTGFECIVPPSGDSYLSHYWPRGLVSSHWYGAFVCLHQTYASGAPGPGFYEGHDLPSVTWYGDIGLAPTNEAGAIFAWSQVYERHGVFALRFTRDGRVTGVPPEVEPAPALRLRFAAGRGVVATLGSVTEGRIRLFDVTGRVRGGADVPAGAREVTLEGTAPLAPGLYFARHRGADGAIETGRVVIVR